MPEISREDKLFGAADQPLEYSLQNIGGRIGKVYPPLYERRGKARR